MILIVGTGGMSLEYAKVLDALGKQYIAVGRGQNNVDKFSKQAGVDAVSGGLEKFLEVKARNDFSYAIVSTGVEQLSHTTQLLIESGFKNILVEKPAGLTSDEVEAVAILAKSKKANVYVAYNRRFYASVLAAKSMIDDDGGVESFNFELTEWGHVIEGNLKPNEVKEHWFLANTTHVADMAYFLGGFPEKLSCYSLGGLDWHSRSHSYSGAGISESGALFSYNGNWQAPGRWSVEILSRKRRYIFRPMEKLQIQEVGSVTQSFIDIDDEIDKEFKPGLYRQVEAFLEQDVSSLCHIFEHAEHMKIYTEMAGY